MLLLPASKRELPEGLEFHCDRCRIVIPAEAPRPDADDDLVESHCEFIARHKLTWFNPKASVRHQHIMASAAWELIYHYHLRGETPHAESVDYLKQFKLQPELHWRGSTAKASLAESPAPPRIGTTRLS